LFIILGSVILSIKDIKGENIKAAISFTSNPRVIKYKWHFANLVPALIAPNINSLALSVAAEIT